MLGAFGRCHCAVASSRANTPACGTFGYVGSIGRASSYVLAGAVAAERNAGAAQLVIGCVEFGAVLVEGAGRLVAGVPIARLMVGAGRGVLVDPQPFPERALVAVGGVMEPASGAEFLEFLNGHGVSWTKRERGRSPSVSVVGVAGEGHALLVPCVGPVGGGLRVGLGVPGLV